MTKKKTDVEKATDKVAKDQKKAADNASKAAQKALKAIPKEKKLTGLTYDEAMSELHLGGAGFVKLPEWGGYWKFDAVYNKIMVVTKDGEELDTPHYDEYKDRNDWEITDGLTPEVTSPFVHLPSGDDQSGSESVESPASEHNLQMPDMSTSFEENLGAIKEGKKMLLDGEEGVYFVHESGRLKKHAHNGDYIDSAPLYAFQDRSGWSVSK